MSNSLHLDYDIDGILQNGRAEALDNAERGREKNDSDDEHPVSEENEEAGISTTESQILLLWMRTIGSVRSSFG